MKSTKQDILVSIAMDFSSNDNFYSSRMGITKSLNREKVKQKN